MISDSQQATSTGARWGDTPWQVPIELAPTAPPPRCEVVVIGGGFAGLSTAYHLALRGVRVAVLEAGPLGAGASGRTGGLVLEGTAAGPLEQVDACLETIASVVARADIACDLTLGGCRQVRHEAAAAGRRPGWRDGDGWIVVTGTEPGGTVDPGKLVAGLAAAARRGGAELCPGVAVHALAARNARGYRVICDGGVEIEAEQVVVALNAYAAQLVRLPHELHAALTLALCTAPVDAAFLEAIGFADPAPFYTLDLPYLWGRWVPDGRLIFGAGLIFPDDGDVRGVDLGEPSAAHSMAHLEERVRALHPALAAIDVTHRWGGPIAFRREGAPFLGRVPGAPGVIVCAGCAGHGVALSVRVGQLITAAVVDGAPFPAWGALPPTCDLRAN